MKALGAVRVGQVKRGGRLRQFQEALSRRIGAAASVVKKDLRLGVRIGGSDWLLALPDAGEVIPVPPITPAPMTKPWVLGIANVRGRLYTVTDLAAFFDEPFTPIQPQARLLLVGQRYNSNAAILVERVTGLRSVADMSRSLSENASWELAQYHDAQGKQWRELALPRLLAAKEFTKVAV